MARAWLFLVAVLLPTLCVAQMKLIPQSRLDSVANPRTVASRLMVEGGASVDLGSVEESAIANAQVVLTNKGERPLAVTRISTTCRCLVARCDARVVRAGESVTLSLTYYPKGHPGAVTQRVMIYTDLSDTMPTAVCDVRGYVRPMTDRRGDYPYACGALLLRRRSAVFTQSRTERIACMNGGQQPLRIVRDTLLSTEGIALSCDPEVLEPGCEGDLVITLGGMATKQAPRLFVEGVMAPPSQREIRIITEKKQ